MAAAGVTWTIAGLAPFGSLRSPIYSVNAIYRIPARGTATTFILDKIKVRCGKHNYSSVHSGQQIIGNDSESAVKTFQSADGPRFGDVQDSEQRERQDEALPSRVDNGRGGQPLSENFVDHHQAGVHFAGIPLRGAGRPDRRTRKNSGEC